jgi:electron transfer flavoprotein beta subunit
MQIERGKCMKVLVTVKRVIDPNVKVRIKSDGSGVETANVKMTMNPFDEIAVEEAVRLKEQSLVNEVVAVSVGPAQNQEVLRTALAMGADRGILLEMAQSPEPLVVAKLIREIVREEKPDLVIVGKQAIDDDCNQTGQILAALLGWPQATFTSSLAIRGVRIEPTREIDSGTETLDIALPAVVTTDLRLNEPRYTTLPSVMKAKRLPLIVRKAAEMGVDLRPRLAVLGVEEHALRPPGERLSSARAFAEKLINVLGAG